MGWKTFKEYFGISHIVTADSEFIHIGSQFISSIVKINRASGELDYGDSKAFLLKSYPKLLDATQDNIKSVIDAEDHFAQSLPVWRVEQHGVSQFQCESYGWPNVTHDGQLMYENEFFDSESGAITEFLNSAQSFIRFSDEQVHRLSAEMNQLSLDKNKMLQAISVYKAKLGASIEE